jgi:hypothetical protein
MKVQSGSGTTAATATSRSQGQAAAGFEPMTGETASVARAGPTGSLGAVHSLDALLALQEAPGPTERRRRAVKRAGKLLDILDSMKISMLEGGSPGDMLAQLKGAVDESRSETDDPRLEGVLDEIETRAAVELAKEDMARQAAARAA